MSMSRKNYNAIATNFGAEMRRLEPSATYGAWEMVEAFAEVAKQDNLRDLDGKLVKGYKPSHSG